MTKNANEVVLAPSFFHKSAKTKASKKMRFTRFLIPQDMPDGSSEVKPVIVEQQTNPLVSLRFDDFTISKLIKSGIQPKSLMIQLDQRFGLDAEVDAFNQYLVENGDKLFNLVEN